MLYYRQLNLQDQVIPFGLMLFLTGSMSHADQAKLQTGNYNINLVPTLLVV